jgi:predicted nucleic acid-binding protein
MRRTYVDAGVLVTAARGSASLSEPAIRVLCDPEREFVSSLLVRLEVLPRALNDSELEFYETYFQQVAIWAPFDTYLLTAAIEEAQSSGVSPLEAIHLVLATATGCQELVTADKPDAPIYATKRLPVVGLT